MNDNKRIEKLEAELAALKNEYRHALDDGTRSEIRIQIEDTKSRIENIKAFSKLS